jgi:hypothetical protein
LIAYVRDLHGKEIWRVGDNTGEIKLLVPSHRYLKERAKIHLKNCYVKSYNHALEIHTKYITTISGP